MVITFEQSNWLETTWKLQTRWFVISAIPLVILLGLISLPLSLELAILGILVALFGLPHGSLDHLIGRAVFQPKVRHWWPIVFIFYYMGFAAIILLAWIYFPVVSLAAFLLISIIHFGLEHAEGKYEGMGLFVVIPFLGMIPVLIPIIAHQQIVAEIFGVLIQRSTTEVLELLVTFQPLLIIVMFLSFMIWGSYFLRHQKLDRSLTRWHLTELLVLILSFSLVPPLLAFVIYFCGFHATKASLGYAYWLDPTSFSSGLRKFIFYAFPLTFFTVIGGVLIWQLGWAGSTNFDAILRIVFIGLGVLTYPHVLLTELFRPERTAPFSNY